MVHIWAVPTPQTAASTAPHLAVVAAGRPLSDEGCGEETAREPPTNALGGEFARKETQDCPTCRLLLGQRNRLLMCVRSTWY